MKTKQYLFIGGAMAALLCGCDIERLPYNEIPADKLDVSSIETITRGTYAKLKEQYYYKSIHQLAEYGGDNVSLSGTTSDPLQYTYRCQRNLTASNTSSLWRFSYQAIINVNAMIESIPEGESAEKDQLLGENYFLRGFLYFYLVQVFGKPYAIDDGASPGVPLKLTTELDDFPPRATTRQVYEQVERDMLKAEALMSENKSSIFASKEVAQAYLSRIYLYMDKWNKCVEYSTKVIDSRRYTLLTGTAYENYPQAVPEENTETIFAIRMLKDVDNKKYDLAWNSAGSMYAKINEQGWGEMYASYSYMKLLSKSNTNQTTMPLSGNRIDRRWKFIVGGKQGIASGQKMMFYVKDMPVDDRRPMAEDNRKPMYVSSILKDTTIDGETNYKITERTANYTALLVQKDNGGWYVTENAATATNGLDGGKHYVLIDDAVERRNDYPKWYIYKISYQEQQDNLYSPVMIRLAEMYLNRAEAEFKQNNAAGTHALEDINTIRQRAGISELPAVTLDDILDERRLELAWEAHRKYDIYRNKQNLDRNYPGTHCGNAPFTDGNYTIDWSAASIVEYLPQTEMDAYPIPLEQNP